MIENDSLCVFCDKSCKKTCSWSAEFVPVDGWNARETARGYFVYECPEYEDEKPIRHIDTDGAMRLAEALASQINDDYIHGETKTRLEIEHDLREGPAKDILQLSDTEGVIRKLRRLAYQHGEKMKRAVQP